MLTKTSWVFVIFLLALSGWSLARPSFADEPPKYTVQVFKLRDGRRVEQEDRKLVTIDPAKAIAYMAEVRRFKLWSATSDLPRNPIPLNQYFTQGYYTGKVVSYSKEKRLLELKLEPTERILKLQMPEMAVARHGEKSVELENCIGKRLVFWGGRSQPSPELRGLPYSKPIDTAREIDLIDDPQPLGKPYERILQEIGTGGLGRPQAAEHFAGKIRLLQSRMQTAGDDARMVFGRLRVPKHYRLEDVTTDARFDKHGYFAQILTNRAPTLEFRLYGHMPIEISIPSEKAPIDLGDLVLRQPKEEEYATLKLDYRELPQPSVDEWGYSEIEAGFVIEDPLPLDNNYNSLPKEPLFTFGTSPLSELNALRNIYGPSRRDIVARQEMIRCAPGKYKLGVQRHGFETLTRTIVLKPGETLDLPPLKMLPLWFADIHTAYRGPVAEKRLKGYAVPGISLPCGFVSDMNPDFRGREPSYFLPLFYSAIFIQNEEGVPLYCPRPEIKKIALLGERPLQEYIDQENLETNWIDEKDLIVLDAIQLEYMVRLVRKTEYYRQNGDPKKLMKCYAVPVKEGQVYCFELEEGFQILSQVKLLTHSYKQFEEERAPLR